MDDQQLGWVQRARSSKPRVALIEPIAREFTRTLSRAGPAWRQKLIGVLCDEVGPELLDKAEPVSIRRGVLTFHVDEAAAAYDLHLRWEQQLLALITARLPQAGVHTIRFTTIGTRLNR